MNFRALVVFLALAGCAREPAAEIAQREDESFALTTRRSAAEILAPDRSGKTALHHAAERGEARLVHQLLVRGVDANPRDLYDETPLSLAAANGRLECVEELLLAGAAREAQTGFGRGTALHRAAEGGQVSVARLLLEHGADANALNRWGQTPLHAAAAHPRDASVAALLLERGARPDAIDEDGFNPLQHAAARGNRAVVELLVARGEPLAVRTARGSTLLDLALLRRGDASAQYLFEKGAVSTRFPDAVPPLHEAAARDDVETTLRLLAHGAQASFVYQGKTALQYGLEHGGNANGALRLLNR